ncbi:hypothetical protein JMJ35_002730 [Cladonia borealis]|uniref:Extracellular membrane protein CFEM domain-containing protein n=1 Tax=Cladonia borealis TaxID=184061 RepID=A0AA39UDC0_9LECA|nr:hypothetical protein JMJ35_002730 [Cladonia borealis]
MPLLPTLHAIPAVHCRLGFVQQVIAITQAPGFDSLSPCEQNIAVAVIDDSSSPECPGGSPPYCFCEAEAASQEYFDQISTNILKSCLTSPAATIFAAYCSLGDAMTAGTTAASKSTSTSSSSSYSLSPSSSEARTTTSSAAQGASSISTSTSGPTSSSNSGSGLDTSDIVALAVGIPGTIGTIAGAHFAYKTYKKKSARSEKHT